MGNIIKVENSVRNLRFVIDRHLDMRKQINQVCAQGYFILKYL